MMMAILLFAIVNAKAQWSGTNPMSTSSQIQINSGYGTYTNPTLLVKGGRNVLPLKIYYSTLTAGSNNMFEIQSGDDNGAFTPSVLRVDYNSKFLYKFSDVTSYDFNIGGKSFFKDNVYFKNKVIIGSTPSNDASIFSNTTYAPFRFGVEGNSRFMGKVQIGATKPINTYANYTLSVDGDIVCKRNVVQIIDWADFVFEDTYKKMPLGEVEKYINQNKHLPNMPTESQLQSQGMDMGEMLKLQQQKIEELTLYIIDMQKQLDALKTKN